MKPMTPNLADVVGFFTDPTQERPAYDPGLDVNCPICGETLTPPLVTVSFYKPGSAKSYFYRVHKCCTGNREAIRALESEFIDCN